MQKVNDQIKFRQAGMEALQKNSLKNMNWEEINPAMQQAEKNTDFKNIRDDIKIAAAQAKKNMNSESIRRAIR